MAPAVWGRTATSSPSNTSIFIGADTRKKLHPQDIVVGSVVWLPSYVPGGDRFYCEISGEILDSGAYWHPAVVLNVEKHRQSFDDTDPKTSVATMTSFGDLTLPQYLENSRKMRQAIPVLPAGYSRQQITDLTLEEGRQLAKQSYVKLAHLYTIPISSLRVYDGSADRAHQPRLDEKSYNVLMKLLGQEPETFPQTEKIQNMLASKQQSWKSQGQLESFRQVPNARASAEHRRKQMLQNWRVSCTRATPCVLPNVAHSQNSSKGGLAWRVSVH